MEINGKPDVIITDPPRAGMHEKVVKQILQMSPERIVYVSCNSATQARDVAMMTENYSLARRDIINTVLLFHAWHACIFIKLEYFFGENSPIGMISYQIPAATD